MAKFGTYWRNNSGAWKDAVGRLIRYGLGSFTKKDKLKSGDWVGITPVYCYVPEIGWTTLGVFTNVEMKHSDWKFYQSDETACHQKNFHDIVIANGGFAGFARNPEEFRRIIKRG